MAAEPLNLFPARAALGRVDAAGNVYASLEFSRALAALLVRVGGPMGTDLGEIALDVATLANASGSVLAARMSDLDRHLAQAVQLVAHLAELRKQVAALEVALVQVAPPTDWEHPGKIGARKASTGQFTTVNKVTITAPAGAATLTLGDGKTFTVSNTLTLAGNDGSTLTIGAGGTLGSAAYKNTGDFAASSGITWNAAATDATSTQNLVNQIRNVLISVGIGHA